MFTAIVITGAKQLLDMKCEVYLCHKQTPYKYYKHHIQFIFNIHRIQSPIYLQSLVDLQDNQGYRTKNHLNFVCRTTGPSVHLFRQTLGLPGNKPAKCFICNISKIFISERILL